MQEKMKSGKMKIVDYLGENPNGMRALMDLYFNGTKIEVQRVSHILMLAGDAYPHFIQPYLNKMIDYLNQNPMDAVKRNTLRILQFQDIPASREGELFEKGISYLQSKDEPIAVKAFAMTVCRKICERYPELSNELIPIIEILVQEKVSTGIVSRGRKELFKLNRLQEETDLSN